MITANIIAHWEINVIDPIKLKRKLMHRGVPKLAASFPETKKNINIFFKIRIAAFSRLKFEGKIIFSTLK